MTKGTLAAGVLWISIAGPAVAHNPLAKLPPVPRFAGEATRSSVKLERTAVMHPPRWPPRAEGKKSQ
jgi:hypothetical protein